MTVGLVRHWLRSGKLELPLPGSGETARRWSQLSELAREDIVAARIAEAHADAIAILHELGAKPAERGQLWGVWAAESPEAVLTATPGGGDEVLLDGTKAWCSGAGFCTHALVTALLPDGSRGLYAVAVADPSVRALPSRGCNVGMSESDTRAVQFTAVRAVAVGAPGAYLRRPGF